MPGFRGIKMVSFDKKQKQVVVQPPPSVEDISWPDTATFVLMDVMASSCIDSVRKETKHQLEDYYYQKAFETLVCGLEKKNISADFLKTLDLEKMKIKWQEIETTRRKMLDTMKSDNASKNKKQPQFNPHDVAYRTDGTKNSEAQFIQSSASQSHTESPPVELQETVPITQKPSNSTRLTSKERESEEKVTVSTVVEKAIPRVLERINVQTGFQLENSEQQFKSEILRLKRRKIELLKEEKDRENLERVETRALLNRLVDVLEKLSDKL
ncbi:hypothetical protein BY458DRAFT_123612 [Sporodiniella umbellata]|nr:hypothetical protein BY458DRAFT_123612 [Sporodiniella umbellata]